MARFDDRSCSQQIFMINSVVDLLRKRVLVLQHAAAAACCMLVAAPLAAHPHVWITYASVAQMHGSTLNAVQEKWTFSQGFPVSIVGDLADMPKAGSLGPRYVNIFKQQAFDSLKGADYFTHVFVDGKPVRFGEPRNFAVSIDDGRIVYTFELPLADKVDVRLAQVQLGIWDETFFVDFQPPPKGALPVVFDAAAPKTCTAQPLEDKAHPIFGGTIYPLSVKLAC
ncbi:ABC-type uncharacterized transport system periplasmic component-like protein [Paraburkholderia phytofirmans PsJN]|uniref:ABC-type uncharacterized transport system periplasmic component-like protein n=2 Tax=Paraburkholderia phytofirmans TaxID=261302 RepID=B2TEX5_PARPJ|nr:ABC-type uncharacterized transport system periplasmic component-like protein [Paraburkholderia phytofirmans PsJN]